MPKTYVVVHFPTVYSAPVGIWWWNDIQNCPNSYYVDGSDHYRASVVDLLGSARDEQHWNSFTQKLVDRTPYADSFESETIEIAPKTFLAALRKKAL